MSEFLKILYLGIVEGLTEFIPVSSTGHLILSEHLVNLEMASAESFAVFIQLGAILAVIFLYWQRFRDACTFRQDATGLVGIHAMRLYFVACLPAFIFGALFHSSIKAFLFYPQPVAWALIVGGVLFILAESPLGSRIQPTDKRPLEEIKIKDALVIGLFQCLALWPGMSRSGSTILGGLLVGLERRAAAEFSFLVAVPVMVAAVSYDLVKDGMNLTFEEVKLFGLGFVVAFITAIFAIRFFILLLKRWTLAPFGWYRIALGSLVLWLI